MKKAALTAALVPLCLACLGCASASGPSNCVTVEAGRPFVAQAGMRYGIEEANITYRFNPSAYPNAQVVFVDPGDYHSLQPGRVYVMLPDPTYAARQREDEESTERFEKTMDDWSHSFDGMHDLLH